MARPTNERVLAVVAAALGLLGLLWLRCVWLQVVAAPRYRAIANSQHEVRQILRARRGTVAAQLVRPSGVQ